MRSTHGLMVALAEAREELFIMLLLWAMVAGLIITQSSFGYDLILWIAMLTIQSLPYLAAMFMALVSSLKSPQ